MIRILQIIGSLNMGGAENFIVNIYRNIDRNVIQFDFLVYDKPQGKNFYDEVEKLGAQIYYAPPKKEGIVRNYKEIKKIVKQCRYTIIWRHTDNCFAGIDVIAAKAEGATKCILHSHNTDCGGLEKIMHYILRPFVNRATTDRFACGSEAGRWLFGKKDFLIIPNGIDTWRYRFQPETRDIYRQNLKICDKNVIGHVGRFESAKNHAFIIDVFEEICSRNENAVLLLIGEGRLQENIRQKVNEMGLTDKILFLNIRTDVPELMQAMDVLVMPSLFEGLPVTLIEAQATGLSCVVSDLITPEADVTGNVRFVSLDENVKDWADLIENPPYVDREKAWKTVKMAGFDASDVALNIQKMLINGIEEEK